MVKNTLEMPEEILKFFSIEENRTLLVKGASGAGKTTFALKCLKLLAPPKCGIYYTAKANPKRTYSRYPWIKDILPPENIIDASKTPHTLPRHRGGGGGLRVFFIPDYLRYSRMMMEEIKLSGQPFLVVDNFNLICKTLEASPENFAKDLIEIIQDSDVKAIIVSERGNDVLEGMVEGVIEMTYELRDGRVFRKMFLRKLHGVEIETLVYHFTLNKGEFKCFPILDVGKVLKFMLKKPLQLKDESFLDKMVDRLGASSEAPILLIELNTNSVEEISHIFISSIAATYLRKGYSGIITPMRSDNATRFLASHTDISMKLSNIHFIYPKLEERKDEKFPQNFIDTIQKSIDELSSRSPIFLILRYDLLREIVSGDTAKRILGDFSLKMAGDDICIIITSNSNKIGGEELRKLCSAIIRVFEEHGRIFCYGEKPYTQIYGITFQEKENSIEIKFTPIT